MRPDRVFARACEQGHKEAAGSDAGGFLSAVSAPPRCQRRQYSIGPIIGPKRLNTTRPDGAAPLVFVSGAAPPVST